MENKDNRLNFAIVGCGRISKKHAESIKNIPNAKLIAVCDIKEERAKKIAENNENCRIYLNYDEMLKEETIDVINICTPHDLHAEMTIKAAEAGKNVITEKPMGVTLKEARKMIEECERNNVKLFVVKQNRYNPPIQKLKDAINKNRFGKIFFGNARVFWSRPQSYYDEDEWKGKSFLKDGVLMNQTSHHIDLLQWLIGPIESVFCKIDTMTHDIETEDTAVATLKFKNGALGTFEATTSTYPKNIEGSITVLGEKGSVKVGGFAANKMEIWDFHDFENEDEVVFNATPVPPNVYGYGHQKFIENAIGSILNNKKGFVEGPDGKEVLKVIYAMLKSAKENREVFVDEISEDEEKEIIKNKEENKKKVNVLLTSVGLSTGSNVINALRNNKEYKIKIVGVDMDHFAPGLYLSDKKYAVSRIDDPNYIDEILKICEKEKIDVLFPLFSKEIGLFAINKKKFDRKGIKIIISSPETIEISDDKYKLNQFFKNKGIPSPKTYTKEEINKIEKFPVYVKPNKGSGSKDNYKINNPEELKKLLKDRGEMVIQDFIEGNEYTIDILANFNNDLVVAIPRIRLKTLDGKCIRGKTEKKEKLIEYTKKIVKDLKIVGPANLQCIENEEGIPYFIEINPRFAAGGLPLSVGAGANTPLMLIKMALGEEITEEEKKWKEGIHMSRYLNEVIFQ